MSAAIEMGQSEGKTAAPSTAATAASGEGEKKKFASDDKSLVEQFKDNITGSKINVLYVFLIFAFIFGIGKWSDSMTFVTAFLALCPLAAALGEFTEDIAKRTNDATAALINVTFGNATELIISLVALKYGHYDIIKFSLIGSIIGNMLLVLGTSFLLAGLKNRSLTFNAPATNSYLSTLILSTLCFIVPTAFATIDEAAENPIYKLRLSREISLLMIGVYGAYLFFQQKTHRHLFDEQPAMVSDAVVAAKAAKAAADAADTRDGEAAATTATAEEEDEDDEEPEYTLWFSIIATGIVALLISVLSDFLVDSIEGAAEGLHLSKHFIGLVLVPIVGNVAEHASAILMAMKLKLDIAVGVALGSAVQIGMFVMPVICIAGVVFDRDLDLHFSVFTTVTLFVTVLLTFAVCNAGSATWLAGLKLCVAYLILCLAFFHAPD